MKQNYNYRSEQAHGHSESQAAFPANSVCSSFQSSWSFPQSCFAHFTYYFILGQALRDSAPQTFNPALLEVVKKRNCALWEIWPPGLWKVKGLANSTFQAKGFFTARWPNPREHQSWRWSIFARLFQANLVRPHAQETIFAGSKSSSLWPRKKLVTTFMNPKK